MLNRSNQNSLNKKKLEKYLDRNDFINPVDSLVNQLIISTFPEITKDIGVNFFKNEGYPKVDIVEYSDRYEIVAAIPGIAKENVNVEINEDVLIISGHTADIDVEQSEDKGKYILKELKHSNFKRTFVLYDNIDKSNINAKFDNGLLVLKVYKKKKEEPKITKIDIN